MNQAIGQTTPGARWPLHPQPRAWEDLESWVRRIAQAYGVSYDAFLLNALEQTKSNARDLALAPAEVLERLAAGSGVPVERLRSMTEARVMAKAVRRANEETDPSNAWAAFDALLTANARQRRRASAIRGF